MIKNEIINLIKDKRAHVGVILRTSARTSA